MGKGFLETLRAKYGSEAFDWNAVMNLCLSEGLTTDARMLSRAMANLVMIGALVRIEKTVVTTWKLKKSR